MPYRCGAHRPQQLSAAARRSCLPQQPPAPQLRRRVQCTASSGAARWQAWWEEAQHGDALAVLASMPDAVIDARDSRGRTALHRAVQRQDAASVQALLSAHANVDVRDDSKQTPLTLLLCRPAPCLLCLRALLAGGACVDVADKRATPLIYSARRGSHEALRVLLAAGAALETRDGEGKTALLWAAAEGQLRCVEALLAAGADVHARSSTGVTPLHAAVARGGTPAQRAAVVACLLDAAACIDTGATSLRGSLLQTALNRGDTATADLLLRAASARTVNA